MTTTYGPSTVCLICGSTFNPSRSSHSDSGWTELCSHYCEQVRRSGTKYLPPEARPTSRLEQQRERTKRKRAVLRAAFVEKVDRMVVFDKCGWRCHICGTDVDRTLSGRHPMGPTIDHLVPLSKGGKDCYENVALAHLSCNARRYVSLPD
jgi:5-methylcytosine-specific restriction endonuclease McrA